MIFCRFVSELPAGPSPLPQHDLRHQELQHYIRIVRLLSLSLSTSSVFFTNILVYKPRIFSHILTLKVGGRLVRGSGLWTKFQKYALLIRCVAYMCIYTVGSLTLQNSEAVIVPHQIMWSWYTCRWWVGSFIWCSEEETGRGPSPPSPLLAVPNVTTASVPITILR